MSNFQFSLDPEKLKKRGCPVWLIKTILIVSVLPFLAFGALMVGRILRIAGVNNHRLVIPFILFVVFFCAVPVAQVFLSLRKMRTAGAIPASIEEVRPDEHSKIQVRDVPDGREFVFPAARNPETGFVFAALLLFLLAMIWGLLFIRTPLFIPIVLGLAGGCVVVGCSILWFTQTRVTINPKEVRVSKRCLIFGGTRSFDAGEIARFDSKDGKTIQLITRSEQKITAATGIANKSETDRLAQEMNKALGRTAS
jgi:hypothetical protein